MNQSSLSDNAPAHVSPHSRLHRAVTELLAYADIEIGGHRPWDIRLNAPGVIERAVAKGNLGLGEAYMDGDWEADLSCS